MIDAKTQLNLVIGYPLHHTQSPLLHNTIYGILNYNLIMLAHETSDLLLTIQSIKTLSMGLVAVTMPYKKEIIAYLDDIDDVAKKLNSVNTLIFRDNKLFGYNTDIDGIAYSLRNTPLFNKNVLIIGAGGAAHAVAYYLNRNHANLLWVNRTSNHILPLINLFGGEEADINFLDKLQIDVIINTTSVGMFPDNNSSPLPHYHFKSSQTVFDMVYNPIKTKFIENAKLKGARCISGLDMFVVQGLKQIELLINKRISSPELVELLKKTLTQSQIES
ncbi:MAG: shikimate dehydrogenase [Gammaproteobacteria bacterium]|nr:shikimate dehydrogenase [Gammaproteobacteria bacterium]